MIRTSGVVRGDTIHLSCPPGIDNGVRVELTIDPAMPPAAWGDGIRRSEGAAAEIEAFDEVFDQLEQQRRLATDRPAG